jgi:hypothetical protein
MSVENGVDQALRQLPPRAERLLRTRYGIGAPQHAPTLQKRSRAQACRIETKALRRLWTSSTTRPAH